MEIQALALRTGYNLVRQLWPIRNRAKMTPSPVILLDGFTAHDVAVLMGTAVLRAKQKG